MTYKPWCPKCADTLYLDETQHPPTVRCWCGYNIVDRNQIKGFVLSQQREYEAQETEKRELARLRSKEAAQGELGRQKAKAQKVTELPQPTAAQRRQGCVCAVHCAVCGSVVWRRKCEIGEREHFFCSREHQASWQKQNPVGAIRQRERSTG